MMRVVAGLFLLSFSFFIACTKKASVNCNNNICPDSLRITIKHGETQTLCRCGKNSVALHFDKIVDDSRCPTGTTCVWAGTAYIDFTLSNDDQLVNLELGKTIPVKLDSRDFRLTFEALSPYPDSSGINPSNYEATLFFKIE